MIKKTKILILGLLCLFKITVSAQDKPLNVIWINSDDLGRELACYGHPVVKTPNLDALAKQGILYKNAYANAPVCSTSRTSQITGMYPTAVNGENHRTMDRKALPNGIKPITDFFKEAGYFISNGNGLNLLKTGGKKDYNFEPSIKYDGTDWNQRKEGQPFFAQVQIKYPHRTFKYDKKNPINPDDVQLPACYLDHPLLRADWAKYLESVQHCDEVVGKVLEKLEKDGLAENTVVFFFGDHGRPHVRDKQFLYEGGLQIPLIVRWPNKLKANKTNKQLVSLVDVAATTLNICGLKTPYQLDGKAFLGAKKEKRQYIYGFRQRTGDAVENMRSITNGRYKLILNRTTDRSWMQLSSYKKLQYPAFALYHYLHEKGKLPAPYNQFMEKTKPALELFDLKKDPSEFNNLAGSTKYAKVEKKLLVKLKEQLAISEKNNVPESETATQKGIEGSQKYYRNSIAKKHPGLTSKASYEDLVNAWDKELLKEGQSSLIVENAFDYSQWDLKWEDNFDYKNSDLDNEWLSANYSSKNLYCSRWRENAVIRNGELHLDIRKEKRGGQDWTAGSVWTKKKFKYGYFECRYKYAGGEATNNSFWLMTQPRKQPEEGAIFEIDINEGHYPNEISTNVHNWSDITVNAKGRKTHPSFNKMFFFGTKPTYSIQLELPIQTQKIRFISKQPSKFNIGEFRIYNVLESGVYPEVLSKTADTDVKGLINYATASNVQIKASGTSNPKGSVKKLVDGNPFSSWSTQKEGDKWVEFAWDKPVKVGCIQFTNGWRDKNKNWRNLIHEYKVQYLKDGEWRDISVLDAAETNDFSKEFHTYGLEWNEKELIFYFDGKELRRSKNDFCYSETPIWLSLALIKWHGTLTDDLDGKSMKVDYVKYYQEKKK